MTISKGKYEGMLKEKYTDFEVEIYKIAKRYEISMAKASEFEIQFWEEDTSKGFKFIDEINKLSPRTRVVELISIRQHIDTKENDIRKSKSLYLLDDDYYNAIIGSGNDKNENIHQVNEQMNLFSM